MTVQNVLRRYLGGVHMGEAAGVGTIPGGLSADLAAISSRNRIYFQICFASVGVLLAGSCALVIAFIDDPGRVGTVFGVTGVTIVGLIGQMIGLWKQKVAADIIVVLARNVPGPEIKPVLDVLLAKL
jgi:hypothetical protein